MNLKYSAAFSFAVLVFCSLVSSKLDIGTGFLMIVSFAALNGWFFIYNLCRYFEAIIALRTDIDAKSSSASASST
ncbi:MULTISPECIES: hypothetical protein [Burkholderia]|jgi:hypothetical protein|uniref:Uncharacterized protein n=2 Tax=Burkholderia cepacia complex TaxID=87882 RepID=A0AAP1VBX2_9BURK|nr:MULTISPECIES: hypothetical protein [Burkholderia cepacia complex]ELK7724865.1 hypothetical protein [Burkholderia cenocepacia]UTP27807.1 hypothetical protein NMB33_40690 [Burkholderia sp. FXe9]MBA9833423.1 hypothetical protein [Burkholderia contaminans]MBH9693796.1 hypothetical protein [Burkholderia contaminans]MBK1905455.1 hypothetical protein [Burkholderia contaminans]